MLQEDPKRTHVPSEPQLIVALYIATNQPMVQPVGRAAQAAQGAVVAVREGAIFHVMVTLTLVEGRGAGADAAGEPAGEAGAPGDS